MSGWLTLKRKITPVSDLKPRWVREKSLPRVLAGRKLRKGIKGPNEKRFQQRADLGDTEGQKDFHHLMVPCIY